MLPIKCVILGNEGVGKSTLIHSYINRQFTAPPGFSCGHYLTKATTTNGTRLDLLICDTLGAKGYEHINRLSYRDIDVVIICFAIEKPEDIFYVRLRWIPEVQNHCPPGVPVVLGGTKSDCRNAYEMNAISSRGYVSHEQGLKLAQDIYALDYKECSAFVDREVSAVFDTAVTCGLHYRSLNPRQLRKRTCAIL